MAIVGIIIVVASCFGIVGYFTTRKEDTSDDLSAYTQLTVSNRGNDLARQPPGQTGGERSQEQTDRATPSANGGKLPGAESKKVEMPSYTLEARTNVLKKETSPYPPPSDQKTDQQTMADAGQQDAGRDIGSPLGEHLTSEDFPFQELPAEAVSVEFPLVLVKQEPRVTEPAPIMAPALGGQGADTLSELRQNVYRVPKPPPPRPRPPPGPGGPPEESPSGL